jgi:signal peptidase I
MDTNPYAANSKAELGASEEPVTRSRWLASLIALLLPPVAMLYLGRPWRALAYLGATHGLSIAIMLLSLGGFIGFGTKAIWLPLVVLPLAAIDAWRLAPRIRWQHPPWYARGGAVVGAAVLSFVVPIGLRFSVIEPYRIPSVAMEPTLRRGDQILVDKLAYGWSAPLGGKRLVRFAVPARGDVATLRSPQDETLAYVKRIVGVPGDRIECGDKQLSVNGKVLPLSLVPAGPQSLGFPPDEDRELYTEGDGGESRQVFYKKSAERRAIEPMDTDDACTNDGTTLRCTVPDGMYFVMGDNRDNSQDSRHFGFISEDAFIGRVTRIWASDADPARAGQLVR